MACDCGLIGWAPAGNREGLKLCGLRRIVEAEEQAEGLPFLPYSWSLPPLALSGVSPALAARYYDSAFPVGTDHRLHYDIRHWRASTLRKC